MSPDRLRAIHDEIDPDFSALVCKGATVSDLDEKAIDRLRRMWMKRSGNSALANISTEQLLRDCDLMHGKSLSNAAVILLGSNEAIRNYVSQAEVVYEYRATENSIDYQLRREFKAGFLLILDGLWNEVNKRNYVQTYREGLFAYEIPTFNEVAVREAILNAVSHRDYRLGGSVFLRQFPTRLEIISPGGLPSGITTENILDRQAPRNRKIAELLSKCGLVERSGQGMNRIVENAIRESKRRPDFNGTDDYQVSLTLSGEVQDTNFLRFLEKVGEDRLSSFTTQDFLAVDLLHKDERIPEALKPRVRALMEEGIVERVGSGRGVRYMLSGRFYEFVGKPGAYTRKRGLDRETNKALLVQHLHRSGGTGARLQELQEVLPSLSRYQIQTLLRELKRELKVHVIGLRKSGMWFSGPERMMKPFKVVSQDS